MSQPRLDEELNGKARWFEISGLTVSNEQFQSPWKEDNSKSELFIQVKTTLYSMLEVQQVICLKTRPEQPFSILPEFESLTLRKGHSTPWASLLSFKMTGLNDILSRTSSHSVILEPAICIDMEAARAMGILFGGWENETWLKGWGNSEVVLEWGSKFPHFLWTVFISVFSARYGRYLATQPGRGAEAPSGSQLLMQSLLVRLGVRDTARMEKELDENLSVVHRVERSHSCWETRKIYVKEEILQMHLGW